MSTYIRDIVDDCARAISDPKQQRVDPGQWLSIYNRSNRELGEKVNLFRFIDKFDLIGGQRTYVYPDGTGASSGSMTVMNGIHVSDTPDDETTFRWIEEIFQDDFRRMTSNLYPTATLPEFYFATTAYFYLVPTASADIPKGACIDYFGLPKRVALNEFVNGQAQIPDIALDYLIRRMIIHGLESRNRHSEAAQQLQQWNADMEGLLDKLEDRSNDKRSSLAPRKPRFWNMR